MLGTAPPRGLAHLEPEDVADLLEGGDVLRGRVQDRDELALDLRERVDELAEVDDLVLVEPLTGVRRVDEEEGVLAVVGLERLAVVLPQDAHVLQALGGLEVLLGVGRRAEVLLRRVRAVGAAVAGVGAHEDELVEARDVVLRRHVAGLGEALLRDGPLEAAAQLLDALGRHRLDAAVEEHHVVVEIGDHLLAARVLGVQHRRSAREGLDVGLVRRDERHDALGVVERPAERAEGLRFFDVVDVVDALVECPVPVVEDELVVERLGGRLVVRDQELRQHGAAADAAHVRDGAPGADAL